MRSDCHSLAMECHKSVKGASQKSMHRHVMHIDRDVEESMHVDYANNKMTNSLAN